MSLGKFLDRFFGAINKRLDALQDSWGNATNGAEGAIYSSLRIAYGVLHIAKPGLYQRSYVKILTDSFRAPLHIPPNDTLNSDWLIAHRSSLLLPHAASHRLPRGCP